MRAVDAVMECLKAEGVDVVFGYPGGADLPTYDAFVDAGIKHVLVRHEVGGGHAAEGYAKASGKVGVVFATFGPGATNIVTPLTENKPGVLSRIAGLFARRRFNIDTLAVGPTDDERLSRLTLTLDGAMHPIDQVTKQLHKLVNVIKIRDLEPAEPCRASWRCSRSRPTAPPAARSCRSWRSSAARSSTSRGAR